MIVTFVYLVKENSDGFGNEFLNFISKINIARLGYHRKIEKALLMLESINTNEVIQL